MKHLPHTRFSPYFSWDKFFSTKPKDFCLAESTELCYSGNALDLLDSDNERDLILKSDEEIFFTLPGRGHFATDEKPPKKIQNCLGDSTMEEPADYSIGDGVNNIGRELLPQRSACLAGHVLSDFDSDGDLQLHE